MVSTILDGLLVWLWCALRCLSLSWGLYGPCWPWVLKDRLGKETQCVHSWSWTIAAKINVNFIDGNNADSTESTWSFSAVSRQHVRPRTAEASHPVQFLSFQGDYLACDNFLNPFIAFMIFIFFLKDIITQVNLKLTILLPQFSKWWDYMLIPPCLAFIYMLKDWASGSIHSCFCLFLDRNKLSTFGGMLIAGYAPLAIGLCYWLSRWNCSEHICLLVIWYKHGNQPI